MGDSASDHVAALARRRAEARSAGDFQTADRLRAEVEAAGWKIVDYGRDYRLEPAHPPDREVGGVTHYGSSATVPSRVDEPPTAPATVVLVAGSRPDRLAESARLHRVGAASQLVIVAEQPDDALEARLAELDESSAEVVRLAGKIGLAGCWNAAIRRATGAVVVLTAPDAGLHGDVAAGPAAALADEELAVVGSAGLVSGDLRRWLPSAGPEVDALDAEVLAFRCADWIERGPLDERFVDRRLLSIWWSLVLRDSGPEAAPRLARVLALPVDPAPSAPAVNSRDRAARRDFYRIVDRFGRRHDLLREPVRPTVAAATARRR